MNSETGKYIMVFGGVLLLVGALVYFFGGKLGWIGNLPGDIKIERENSRFYFPITTMILVSVLFSVLMRIFRKFF